MKRFGSLPHIQGLGNFSKNAQLIKCHSIECAYRNENVNQLDFSVRSPHCFVMSDAAYTPNSKAVSFKLVRGLLLCGLVALAAIVCEYLETHLSDRVWLEALVLAIIIGVFVRTAWAVPKDYKVGIDFAAKTLLEIAVALMGATISFATLMRAGLPLILGVVIMVIFAIACSFLLGRTFGLPAKMAMLIACGNAICGNSAIAAVAPTIDASSDDVAAAIAFTAVLGVAVVLLVPVIAGLFSLSPAAGGAFAGLTVYAVPQVIAAAAPLGTIAVQFGTLVKLIRVLMLGPVVAILSLIKPQSDGDSEAVRRNIILFFPWFILVFLMLAGFRSAGIIPDELIGPAGYLSNILAIIAMAGLGLGVDLRSVLETGPRIASVVILSLLLLSIAALALLHVIGLS